MDTVAYFQQRNSKEDECSHPNSKILYCDMIGLNGNVMGICNQHVSFLSLSSNGVYPIRCNMEKSKVLNHLNFGFCKIWNQHGRNYEHEWVGLLRFSFPVIGHIFEMSHFDFGWSCKSFESLKPHWDAKWCRLRSDLKCNILNTNDSMISFLYSSTSSDLQKTII